MADSKYSNETYFLIDHMPAGHWKVSLDPGSVPVTTIQQAASLPAVNAHAHLVRVPHGRFVLHYKLHPLAGQQVSFVERDAHGDIYTIGRARQASGSITFTPAATLTGLKRTIIAEVTQDGHPREDDTLLRYTAPKPAPLPAPRGLRAGRSAGGLRVSWKRVPGAEAYAVTVTLRDRSTRFVQVRGAYAKLDAFPAGIGATVEVRAVRRSNLQRFGVVARTAVAPGKVGRVVRVAPD